MLRYHLAGLVAGLLTAVAGALPHLPAAPRTVMIIEHATVQQCSR
ncbi:hypothetical protein [Dactylosporangium fulvum]|uniref:Uncharacterized protein n=1 Tax=Dactylosporangium fulvum TaxID=53359 RepID=A0ABY5VVV0_9ACTN|nr:hypothetical protein [Dactylosporangium fulvum]UWP81357.1 hypothetical protein Dfulv_40575 [Dactylosporangium fulvum]